MINRSLAATLLFSSATWPGEPAVVIERSMPAPDWALAERALLRANADAAEEFAAKYSDDLGLPRARSN